MKVAFVLDNYPPHTGGAERVFEKLAELLAAKGHSVRVVTRSTTSEFAVMRKSNLEVFYYPWVAVLDHPLPRAVDITDHIEWADLVHTATYTVARTALRISKSRNKKCVISPFEVLGSRWTLVESNPVLARMFAEYESYVVRGMFDHYHVISNATGDDLKAVGISSEQITTAYPGIDSGQWNRSVVEADLLDYLGLNKGDRVALYYGRPGKSKGIFLLLEAIYKIHSNLPKEMKFGFILGENPGDQRKKFLDSVERMGLGAVISVKEPVSWADRSEGKGISNYVKAANFVIVPSLTEGFGFCAAETCALGVPLVASTAGSLPEVVSGKHLFFEKGNVDSLIASLWKAIDGEFGSRPIKTFSWDEYVTKIESIYKHVVDVGKSST